MQEESNNRESAPEEEIENTRSRYHVSIGDRGSSQFPELSEGLKKYFENYNKTRIQFLESLVFAFMIETGVPPSGIALVEERDNARIRWHCEKINPENNLKCF